ncbi:MAG: HAD family hydrolase [Sarcina sp.]
MIKAIVFDLDDTLISEREYIKSGFTIISEYIAKEHNLEQGEIFALMNKLFEEDSKELFNRLLDSLKIPYDLEYIKKLVQIYREHKPNIKFYEDVIPTIIELKKRGYKIGMITDGYKETQRAKIEALKCENLFDEIIITDELGREFWKPHEKSYKLMRKKLNCEYKSMIYVGDNEEKDFISANKLAIKTIKLINAKGIYKNTNLKEEYLATMNIDSIKKLLNLI